MAAPAFLLALLTACSVYDSELLDEPRPDGSLPDSGYAGAGGGSAPELDGGDGEEPDGSGGASGGGGSGGASGGPPGPAEGCVPSGDDSCPWICPEVCDGEDNDCDGDIDEGKPWEDLGDTCSVGVGGCRSEGVMVCDPDDPSGPTICDAEEGEQEREACDGVDNNCNGITDENFPDADGDGEADCVDTDRDGDGVPNSDDNCQLVANPDQANSDGDGDGDACDGDVDGDGIANDDDNCPLAANAAQKDLDGDGEGDACDPDDDGDGINDSEDNCPELSSPDQTDSDGDGFGNPCDDDDDNDGLTDEADNCPEVENSLQEDGDSDGVGDACDVCPEQSDPGQEDGDSDGVGDLCDNCPQTPNEQQLDTDGDLEGDACDPDDDNDGVLDDGDESGSGNDNPCTTGQSEGCDDNCPLVQNPGQEDSDSDGKGDICALDDDGDGILDDGDGSGSSTDKPCKGGSTSNCDDNCRTTPNPDQLNTDDDDLGDVCDPDDDGDSVVDGEDNCPLTANQDQDDNDADGRGDACDPDDDNDGDSDTNDCAPFDDSVFHGAGDESCNGVDNDCDGETDEEFPEGATTCGYGVCLAAGTTTCIDGEQSIDCTPGSPTGDDVNCDNLDDNCDGETDEGYIPDASCGVGYCKTHNTPSSCNEGQVTGCQPADPLSASDATCDGVDDNCDGETDEDYGVQPSSCGVGACSASGSVTCVNGEEQEDCTPGTPAGSDATCDGIDDNCDGETDEQYEPDASCGVGYCRTTNTPSSCSGGVETPCQEGTKLSNTDTTCDRVDDDCDGLTDDDINCWTEFSYDPSNFDPAAANPEPAPELTLLDCDAAYDSSTPDDFSGWCGQPAPAVLELVKTGSPDLVVIALRDLQITGSLTISGDRPVVLAVFGDASISGDVSVDAVGRAAGPGADHSSCATGLDGGDATANTEGACGGAGGVFGSAAGTGGRGHDGCGTGPTGGDAIGTETLAPLLGGCSGGRGGYGGQGATDLRWGGGGGGAVQISVAGELALTGSVTANGGGGEEAGNDEDGGGGGGSGGGILLEGDTVSINAVVTANGGGGGEGSNAESATGNPGCNGTPNTDQACGGSGDSDYGGDGGQGVAMSSSSINGGNGVCQDRWVTDCLITGGIRGAGGGGGGGSVGRIRINSPNTCTISGTLSPAPSDGCAP